ncbi:uncharacterized protein N7483_000697 [Penicillium malachiteum]|uniref:uncharacterized protein n=1 Tax=Penicillium malachiteum TaxID=1324776 RepID=UPI002546BFB6|nr:uncharacterized protein N7483_000697 [Penicillium malachiteum]KAJ5735572.1 hypothetical protein N7483_000697 [Penicillium malachiteum]
MTATLRTNRFASPCWVDCRGNPNLQESNIYPVALLLTRCCTRVDGTFNSAPDTPSPVYPDRLIRPLPRRTLRSRLSTDAADTIHYPPTPPASQIFYGIPGDSEEAVNESKVYVQQTIESDRHELTPEAESHHGFEISVELESGDEDGPVVVRRSAGFRGSLSPTSSIQAQGSAGTDGVLKSSAGPDGYDAFENTNNKKKRKIPTPGNMAGHHSTLSGEFANMGLATGNTTPTANGDGTGTYYGNGNPASPVGSGISGSGRGRLGRSSTRSSSGRNPLSANAQNAWMTAPRTPSRRDGMMSSPAPSGMIGLAEKLILHPRRSPTSPLSSATQKPRAFSTQGTQTSPNMGNAISRMVRPDDPDFERIEKKKKSPEAVYSAAARRRQNNQQYHNAHNPPRAEDNWICEFCEYERIFGTPPTALIRQYEIKDRKQRKLLAEKQRLLEKAKSKGRKAKKATKNGSKNEAAQPGYDHTSVESTGPGLRDDESLGPEYDDENDSIPATNPASPAELKPPRPLCCDRPKTTVEDSKHPVKHDNDPACANG